MQVLAEEEGNAAPCDSHAEPYALSVLSSEIVEMGDLGQSWDVLSGLNFYVGSMLFLQ